MARISAKATLAAIISEERPKLTIVGSAIATKGRAHIMMKVRPSTLRRLEKLTFGPMYLVLEYALVDLIKKLEALTPEEAINFDAQKLNPTQEEIDEIAQIKGTTKTLPKK